GDPLEYLQAVVELCLRVLVGHDPGRVAAAAKVDSDAGITGPGELRVDRRVTARGHVVLAVGNVFENRGNRLVADILGQPDPGGEFDSVSQGNPSVFDDANRSRGGAVPVGRGL